MQKLLRRTAQAERQVARRAKRVAEKDKSREFRERLIQQSTAINAINKDLAAARKARHDAWKLGPLAPKLDMLPDYGVMVESSRLNRSEFSRTYEAQDRCAWAGGVKFLNLAVGDRVVVVGGPFRGKLDVIEEILPRLGEVKLKNYKARTRVPEFMKEVYKNEPGFSEVMEAAVSVPISAIRLVHPLTDPVTNVTRDVVIQSLHTVNVRRDRLTGITEWDRVVPGLNVILPWPEKKRPEHQLQKDDTPRDLVADETFVPTLLRSPMPSTLINELRNQYSRFRTRHEEAYLQRKQAEEDAKKQRATGVATMRTPLQELTDLRRETRRARGQPELTDDMLERIGQIMARNRAAHLNEAGVVNEGSAW